MAGHGPIDQAEQRKRTLTVGGMLAIFLLAFALWPSSENDVDASLQGGSSEVANLPPLSASDIMSGLDYSLNDVADSKQAPALFLSKLTVNLDRIRETEEKKETFFRILLPIIAKENDAIRNLRQRIISDPAEVDAEIFDSYDVEQGDVDELLRRVDVIPASLVLAKAALESGWGTSRFARQGNNFFGMRTYDPDVPGIEPKNATGFKVTKFRNITHNVRSYLKNMNTHEAYTKLRNRRAQMRDGGDALSGRPLTNFLAAYSEIPEEYGKRLRIVMDANDLERFDGVRLAGSGAGS